MAIPEKKRKQIYEDCTINGLTNSEAARKHKVHRETVKQILNEYADEQRVIKEIKDNQLALKSVKNSTEFLDDALDSKEEALRVFKQGLKAQSIPTVKLKSTKTKRVYKHFKDENGNEMKVLVETEEHEDEKEIQSDKLIEHQMKCADRLLTLLTGSNTPQDTNFVVELE